MDDSDTLRDFSRRLLKLVLAYLSRTYLASRRNINKMSSLVCHLNVFLTDEQRFHT